MKALKGVRDFVFRCRYGFRGVPRSFQEHVLRLDESLRRVSPDTEVEVQKVICQVLREGDVMVDVGANFGLHALLGASCVGPTGHVYALEPVPSNCHFLKRHIALNEFENRMTVIAMAASDVGGGTLDLHGARDGITFAASICKDGAPGLTIRVPVTTLDDRLSQRPKPVRLIKIDVEGAEQLVLRGARQLLSKDRPLLLIEVHTFALPSFGTSPEAFRKELKDQGYRERVIDTVSGTEGEYYHALFSPQN